VVGLLAASGTALAAPIDDAAYFDGVAHTLIDFETDGLGNELALGNGQVVDLPTEEYLSQGVRFDRTIAWVDDASPLFEYALSQGGSGENGIPSSFVSEFTIEFTQPVFAAGMFVVRNRALQNAEPIFEALDASGAVIESVTFSDAQFGDPSDVDAVAFGFMGIESNVQIAALRVVNNGGTMFDDLRFGGVPTPGAAALMGLAGLVGARRRRA
jgi:hypothetical protein